MAARSSPIPLARTILGDEACAAADQEGADPATGPLRLFVAVRSRFAEDCLAAAAARGIRQAVVLGAGLDTFGLRNPHAGVGLHVFEVDHPTTQAWKRERLAKAGLPVPASLSFVPVDFERQGISPNALRRAVSSRIARPFSSGSASCPI